jgi:hypothetical protein
MMRLRILVALAALPLTGAASPSGTPGEAAECKLSYDDAQASLARINITRSTGEDPAAEGGFTQYFNPAGVTVLGQAATFYSRAEFEADGVRRVMYRVEIPGTYADTRAAILKLHGKKSCDAYETTEPGDLGCMVHIREEGSPSRDVDMILFEVERRITTGCIYATGQQAKAA